MRHLSDHDGLINVAGVVVSNEMSLWKTENYSLRKHAYAICSDFQLKAVKI